MNRRFKSSHLATVCIVYKEKKKLRMTEIWKNHILKMVIFISLPAAETISKESIREKEMLDDTAIYWSNQERS